MNKLIQSKIISNTLFKFTKFNFCLREQMPQMNHYDTNLFITPIMKDNTLEEDLRQIEMKGRNSRVPKRSNHGSRPCSSVMRRLKKKAFYKKPSMKND